MAVWSGLGINYGQLNTSGSNAPLDSSQVRKDLQYLWNIGFRKIRVSFPTYNQAIPISNCLAIIDNAKEIGFYVIWGVTSGGSGVLTTENYATFEAAILANAIQAEAHGVDQYSCGNEEYLNAYLASEAVRFTLTGLIDRQKETAVALRAAQTFTGIISVSELEGFGVGSAMEYWTANPPQPGVDFDILGWNIYANSGTTFEGYIDFLVANFTSGTLVEIHEWADKNTNRTSVYNNTMTEEQWAKNHISRLNYLKLKVGEETPIFPCYLFTYRWDQTQAARGNFMVHNTYNLHRPVWTRIHGLRDQLAQY